MKIPIVFLHGFLGSKEDWDGVCAYLIGEHCIAINLPGHGTEPFKEDFFDLIPPLPKIHLVGYSMGGRLAAQYAKAFPEKIATLTLLSTFTKEPAPDRFEKDSVWAQKILHCLDDFLKEWYDQPFFAGFTPDLTMRKKHNPQWLACALLHYSPAKQPVISPQNACFVVGEKDQKYRKLYPDAILVPNAGHMVHYEQPALIAKIIRQRILDFSRKLHRY